MTPYYLNRPLITAASICSAVWGEFSPQAGISLYFSHERLDDLSKRMAPI